jgi:hypothetical protein
VELLWSKHPESYVGGNVSTSSVSHAGQVKGDEPDKKDTLVFQVGVWT